MSLRDLPADSTLRERRTAADHVADALRAAILSGAFADGQELQVELAAHFGVSRVPIREAVRRLEAEGLVRAEAHRSAVAVGLTPRRIREIFDLRQILEGYLLERAAPHITRMDLDRLTAMCDEMDAIDDRDAWVEANRRFHAALYAPGEATLAGDLAAQLTARIERFLRETGGVKRAKAAGREHRRILRALRRGDVEDARAELDAHIGGTRDRVLKLLGTDGDAPGDEPIPALPA